MLPHSDDIEHEPPPLAALPPVAADEAATVDATVLEVDATVLASLELATEEDASDDELAVEEETLDAVAPPAPVGWVSKSVVEPVAQLITSPKPAANAPIP